MRTGNDMCYAEDSGEAIPFRPEDVVAVFSMRGPVNDIYLKDWKQTVTDRKDSRKSFLDKIRSVCPQLVREMDSERRRDAVWLLDPDQIDWERTRDCNAMEDLAYNSTSDLIMKSGAEIELRTPRIWELARDCGTEDMIRNRNMISYGNGNPRPFSDVAMLDIDLAYPGSQVSAIDRRGYMVRPGTDRMKETQALFRHPGCRFVLSMINYRRTVLINASLYDPAMTGRFRTPEGDHYLAVDSGEGCPYIYDQASVSGRELELLERRIASGKPFLDDEVLAVRYLNAPDGIHQCFVYIGNGKLLYYHEPGQFGFLTQVTQELSVNQDLIDWDLTRMAWDKDYGERLVGHCVLSYGVNRNETDRPLIFRNGGLLPEGKHPVIWVDGNSESLRLSRMMPDREGTPDWFFLDTERFDCPRHGIRDVLVMVPLDSWKSRLYMDDGDVILANSALASRIRTVLGDRMKGVRIFMGGRFGTDHPLAWVNLDRVEVDRTEILTGSGTWASGDRMCPLRSRNSGVTFDLLMMKEEYEHLCGLLTE